MKNTIQHALSFRLQTQYWFVFCSRFEFSNTVPACAYVCVVWLQYFLEECVRRAKQNTSLGAACSLQLLQHGKKIRFYKDRNGVHPARV